MRKSRAAGLFLIAAISVTGSVRAQMPVADSADVSTVGGIVRAFYEVINGPAGAPRQWKRDSTLYMPQAIFVAMDVKQGHPEAAILTPEQYRRAVDPSFVKSGFFETEIGRREERFGNVVQVRSVYETRRVAGGPLLGRGVNYLIIYWDGDRWWISAAAWDDERPDNPIPASWVGQ
jgi:hypothetical protein